MKILGIETSCDETAAAVVDSDKNILSNYVLSQSEHEVFGGVVPEIAARAHMDHLDTLVKKALSEANTTLDQLDGVAVTSGPGLIGGVLVGVMMAKAIARIHNLPYLAINHLEGHALTPRLTEDNLNFPYLLLLVSGGHTQILVVKGVGDYEELGTTIDDALGEAFDKTAKLLGLGYPGGPAVEAYAKECKDVDAALERFPLPRSMVGREGFDMSFSGLKTAVRRHVEKLSPGERSDESTIADLCAAFQTTIGAILKKRVGKAMEFFLENHAPANTPSLVISGGVAANLYLRNILTELTNQHKMRFAAPPVKLCSDNAVMIAWAGLERLERDMISDINTAPRPRWPLTELGTSA
jgi:N6-L-threonylcarbamoyladenine synthase